MDSTTSSPKKLQKKRTQQYSICYLYKSGEALAKLTGLSVAACNPTTEKGRQLIQEKEEEIQVQQRSDFTTISEKMSCNSCETEFESRNEQKVHYKSDWHRYNLRQRLRGSKSVTEDQFEELSGNVSSISGSESESEDEGGKENHATSKPIGIAARLQKRLDSPLTGSSTDSESEDNFQDDRARKYPKIFLKNSFGDLISLYRCVVYHKHVQPSSYSDLISMVTDIPSHMKWAVLMSSGGHFAGAIFDKDKILAHKTFHRYVVRAKRGTAQSSRDSQGNAPKSAGAALRRYNEAALKEDVRELLITWDEHMKSCDLIFLRAPGFNKKIFFSGKAPSLDKADRRIRMIPFQTKRPTHNEVQRVHEMLASIECYGEEVDIQDYVPLSPQLSFSSDLNQLIVVPEDVQSSPRHRKSRDRLGTSPLAKEEGETFRDVEEKLENRKVKGQRFDSGDRRKSKEGAVEDTIKHIRPEIEQILAEDLKSASSENSTASETEMVEVFQTISTGHLKECGMSKKPKRRKNTRQRRPSLRHQQEPGINPLDEERYHLKNSLYTACKVGDAESLLNLLAVFDVPNQSDLPGNAKGQGDSINIKDEGQIILKVSDPDNQGRKGGDIEEIFEIDKLDNICNLEEKVKEIQNDFSDLKCSEGQKVKDKILQDSPMYSKVEKVYQEKSMEKCISNDPDTLVRGQGQGEPGHDRIIEANNKDKSTMKLNVTDENHPSREHSRSRHSSANDVMSPIIVTADLLNEGIGDKETTLLMIVAKEGHKKLIQMLLKAGANPAIRDKYGQTAYQVTQDKECRNEFRRFMAKFPNRYDYDEAKIPGPLTEEMEAERKKKDAERKKVQKKAKQEREKEKKAEQAKLDAEEKEKRRFLALSDREKRAIAAEKRLKQQSLIEGNTVVLSRCYQCGSDMTGKVPFEYFDFKFCSPKCLKEHRQKSTNS